MDLSRVSTHAATNDTMCIKSLQLLFLLDALRHLLPMRKYFIYVFVL